MKDSFLTVRNSQKRDSRSAGPGPLAVALVLGMVLFAMCGGPARAQNPPGNGFGTTAQAAEDSLDAGTESYWGPVPAHHDSVSALLVKRSRGAWETAVMVPYWVVGVPFRVVYLGIDQTVIGMDKLGLFGAAAEHPGIKGPFDTYLMPVVSIGDVEGFTLGLDVTRFDFLGPGNMLFIQGSRSTRKADELSGGTLFHLGKSWTVQAGGGVEEKNLIRYYGLGPDSIYGDLSYYHRTTTWGGLEVEKNVGRKIGLELRSYFSQVEAVEPVYEIHRSLAKIHSGNIPFGYPGQSNGWTMRLALYRDNADQRGRPRSGGFQSLGVSLFEASDGSRLRYLTYHANLEKYLSLWHTDRTLALRAFVNRISNSGPVEIPFNRLVTFQRPDELRGFNSLRFYGMGSVGMSAEYRWPAWVARGRNDMGVDAYVFSDIGQVYDRTAEISMDHMKFTGGAGLRLVNSDRGFAARFEVGFSSEQTVVRLKFSQTFQYDPKGILYGKNPTKVY
ncbi:MAG: BamA/TamA family outer membrane protein [Candidatus Krumholzibacteriota bacterium]